MNSESSDKQFSTHSKTLVKLLSTCALFITDVGGVIWVIEVKSFTIPIFKSAIVWFVDLHFLVSVVECCIGRCLWPTSVKMPSKIESSNLNCCWWLFILWNWFREGVGEGKPFQLDAGLFENLTGLFDDDDDDDDDGTFETKSVFRIQLVVVVAALEGLETDAGLVCGITSWSLVDLAFQQRLLIIWEKIRLVSKGWHWTTSLPCTTNTRRRSCSICGSGLSNIVVVKNIIHVQVFNQSISLLS